MIFEQSLLVCMAVYNVSQAVLDKNVTFPHVKKGTIIHGWQKKKLFSTVLAVQYSQKGLK